MLTEFSPYKDRSSKWAPNGRAKMSVENSHQKLPNARANSSPTAAPPHVTDGNVGHIRYLSVRSAATGCGWWLQKDSNCPPGKQSYKPCSKALEFSGAWGEYAVDREQLD
jgi:hypothetical protein